jgi:hypothetical protein
VALLLLGCTGLVVPAASASPSDPIRVVIVLDVSGSMARPAGGGLTLLGGARRAIAGLVRALPAEVEVGLRVYGSEYAGQDRRRSCRDTRLLVPVGADRAADVVAATRDLRPTGDTPIGRALRAAAGDLAAKPASERVVVLVSDGEDNCSPPDAPPCQVVSGLRGEGVRVRVESVGVALAGRPSAERALRCVADRTGGSYYDAADAAALSAALERISSASLGAPGQGKPVRGADSLTGATVVRPGAYRTTLAPGEQRWFRFRARPGSQPRVLATVRGLHSLRVPPAARDCPAWKVQLYNPFGEGGTYPPYGNAGTFDGVGLGSTGASASGPVARYALGIDYSGLWSVRLSLALDTLQTCSASLPVRRYDVRFVVDLDDGEIAPTRPTGSPSGAVPAPEPASAPPTAPAVTPPPGTRGEGSAAAKYRTAVRPDSTPGWVYPVVAVAAVTALGVALVGLRSLLRRRRQGW